MYRQVYDPVGGSLGVSAIFAVLPLIVLFVLLGGFRVKIQWAAVASLATALLVALVAYSMPVGQALDTAALGAVFGFFPLVWLFLNALWVYNLTVDTGHFAVLRRSFASISDDQRIQVILIAFCFGALLEALAGSGAPVAITGVMLAAIGFEPLKAAAAALVANTAPVAFGAIGLPVTTLAAITGLPVSDLADMTGRQVPVLALFVPLLLVLMTDGRRGVRQAWPAAAVGGLAFALTQFAASNFISYQLADVFASLIATGAIMALLRVWAPRERLAAGVLPSRPAVAGGATHDPAFERDVAARDEGPDSRRRVLEAYAPYLAIIVVVGLAQIGPIKSALDSLTLEFGWPGLDVTDSKGEAVSAATYAFNWASAAGSLLLLSGVVTAVILRISPVQAARTYARTLNQLKWPMFTVMTVLALAYVMNLSGQTVTLGQWLAGAGGVFAFLSPILGWVGTAISGSDTSSNALFGSLQTAAATKADLAPVLTAAGNGSGGVIGKMISPQNLAIGAAAVGLAGREGDLFRRVVGWGLLLLAVMVVIVGLQSTPVLSWMVP